MSILRQNGTQVLSYRNDGSDRRWFGSEGHVNALQYSFVTPGGCDALSFNLMTEPSRRTGTLDTGRIVEAYRGGGKIWEGILQEAVPSPQGWAVSAYGAGQYGGNYRAAYTSMWPTAQPDESINAAIARGMRWKNPSGVGLPGMWAGASGSHTSPGGGTTLCSTTIPAGTWTLTWIVGFTNSAGGTASAADNNNFGLYVAGTLVATAQVDAVDNGIELYAQVPVSVTTGSPATVAVKTIGGGSSGTTYYACIPPAGSWLGQEVDSAAQTVTDLLNLCCTYGGMTWWINTTQHGNTLSLMPLPTVPDRILVAYDPVPRTVNGQPTTIFERYQLTADNMNGSGGTADVAQYATTSSIDQPSAGKYGATEEYIDLTQAGVIPAAAAQAVGNNVLARYLRASFSGTFQLGPGQLLTLGGQPVDLGSEHSRHVYKLVLCDYAYGGEVTLLPPVAFLGGKYTFYDEKEGAEVTPFQYLASDIGSLLSAASSVLPTPFTDS
jgi:hypothetical protein